VTALPLLESVYSGRNTYFLVTEEASGAGGRIYPVYVLRQRQDRAGQERVGKADNETLYFGTSDSLLAFRLHTSLVNKY
jgi:hypothetical protein